MIENTTTPYDWYTENEFNPAMQWLETEEAHGFIHTHFPELETILYNDPDRELNAAYIFYFRSTPLYIGEAVIYSRFCVHMWHMCRDTKEYWGIAPEEVEHITLNIDTRILPDRDARLERERELIEQMKPILQQKGNDRCILRKDRYSAVHAWYNNRKRLGEVITFVIENASAYFGWPELYRDKTPCCDNRTQIIIPYGLAERITEYILSLNKTKRADLLRHLAQSMGGGYWIPVKSAVRVLSRLLSVDEPTDLICSVRAAAQYRILQATKMLNVLDKVENAQ